MDQPSLADRLSGSIVALRPDLEFSRHLFRDEVSYIIRDPISLQTFRLEFEQYRVATRLDGERNLGTIFSELVAEGTVAPSDEDAFYELVLSLHRQNFLNLPISDKGRVYQRWERKRKQRLKSKLLSPFFLKVPMWNPDSFLVRTLDVGRLLFSKPFFVLWILVVAFASFLFVSQREEFLVDLGNFFSVQNLVLSWISLIVLKIFHEFGHAYACRIFGGPVPEMGVTFVIFTPCAYVDASSSWSFPRKWQRLAVNFGGMYVEVFLSAVALIVWTATPPGPVSAALASVVVLSSVTTIAFNVNPLMRFDGYYAMSDWVEVPNLASRARESVQRLFTRLTLGRDAAPPAPIPRRLRLILLGYGFSATVYRIGLVLSITMVIALQFSAVGLALAALYLGMELVRLGRWFLTALIFGPETKAQRIRGALVATALLSLAVTGVGVLTFPRSIPVEAEVLAVDETPIWTRTAGFVSRIERRAGDHVQRGEPLLELSDPRSTPALLEAQSRLDEIELRLAHAEILDPAAVEVLEAQRESARRNLALAKEALDTLVIRAPHAGRLVRSLAPRDQGRFFQAGEWVGDLVEDDWRLLIYLTESELAEIQPRAGDELEATLTAYPDHPLTVRVLDLEALPTLPSRASALTDQGGGRVQVNPLTGETDRAYYRMRLQLIPSPVLNTMDLRPGLSGKVRFEAKPESLAKLAHRQVLRFITRLNRASAK